MGIPYLFEDNEKTFQTQEWCFLLSQSADVYKNCVVKTITHVKNLRSKVVHEYLQAIIEDVDTGNRTRLIAERQTKQDQVILGRWASKKSFELLSSSSSSSSSPSGDLPLPLFSITFDSPSFKVLDLAGILAKTTEIGGSYNLLTKNCYWFAYTAYTALKLKFNGLEEHWHFWKWRGSLILFKGKAGGKAGEFQVEIDSRMRWAPGKPTPTWEFLDEFYKSVIRLEADSSEEAEDIIEENLTTYIMSDMDKSKTLGAMQYADFPQNLSSDLGLDEAYEEAKQLSGISEYIKVYNDYKENERVQEPDNYEVLTPEGFQALELTPEDTEKLEYSVKAMVGQILAEY
ncbi:hypothetical protein BCIN_05g06250 [Botrytis cinerea B05.10]|uniref:Uncharacterized protein n=2 Tax=Botryotinia fuckeliana TaxID=40559 RepID=A0A384JIM9_BOTFB|nr:hypothetical protein BCIN_05g06250 [Botrytis cinerea B05.10]ATZ50257.1 hypothetical protein BCIN_05g06250 [Botrytis cinerea B05.10]EMR80532.1 hypothetical protein BcDW1_10913 [Botrytis cinerea BcDW1]